jgi:hypothetical protein
MRVKCQNRSKMQLLITILPIILGKRRRMMTGSISMMAKETQSRLKADMDNPSI